MEIKIIIIVIIAAIIAFFVLNKVMYIIVKKIIDSGKQQLIKDMENQIKLFEDQEKKYQQMLKKIDDIADKYLQLEAEIECSNMERTDEDRKKVVETISEISYNEAKAKMMYRKTQEEKNKLINTLKEAYDLYETKNWKRRY